MNKSYIPTKTKIAARIMMVIGGIGTIGGLLTVILGSQVDLPFGMAFFAIGTSVFALSLLYFLSGLILFTKRRVAWIVSVGILCIEMLFPLYIIYEFRWYLTHGWLGASHLYWFIPLFFLLFTLILLLSDRKNYWQIAS